ncbi:MAG: PTS fructose transporter subunit IIA [Desulfovibrio sp. MES5]|uniref:EAL domain-containing protein n=1 Tax=Desulfovibrio sp. MES5 TaxID=1899016 RepID=UPI000B9D3026|nr:EAL domain-containing protein [Desulfovibrio sp. MES5]OXS28668.1 MAG: PTS fructose transporter subunit IIA [Desulfovibrio sp. MES5]
MLNKFFAGFERWFIAVIEATSERSTLQAIRSSLVLALPVVFLGSIAALINGFPLPAYRTFMEAHFGPNWRMFGEIIHHSSFSVISLIMLFPLGQHLAEQFNDQKPFMRISPPMVGLVAFASYLCLLRGHIGEVADVTRWMGVSGLFGAILMGYLSARLFFFLFSCRRLQLNLPGGTVDAVIPLAFNALIPAMLTVTFFALIGTLTHAYGGISLPEIIHKVIRMPFDYIGDCLGRGVLYIFSIDLLWFLGIHGANVLDPITHDIYGAAAEANLIAAAAGQPLPHIMTKAFMDIFVFMGGAGNSVGLTGALLLFGRPGDGRRLGAIALVPCVFNINEVLLFGLPLVLNPIMFIPFVFTPVLLAGISYLAMSSGLVPVPSGLMEWTTPIFLNGYLGTGSLWGPALQLFNLALGILAYTPFVLLSNKISERRLKQAFAVLLKRACSTAREVRLTSYSDAAGALARSMFTDLSNDYQNGGKIFLELQPQVCAQNGRVVAAESLLRWHSKLYGPVPAPITVALAEDSNLICQLGLKLVDKACRIRRAWYDAGLHDITIAVNISPIQLTPDFPAKITTIFNKYGLRPDMLEIEVTESGAMDEGSPECLVLRELYEQGFPVAIDDFGMGHTSLKYLRRFPVSTVKIDGGISREVLTNPICADIVASITKLCHAQRITSVAEFVETEEQATTLRGLGCDIFQGYLYSRPLSAEMALQFIRENHERIPLAPGTSAWPASCS